MNAASLGLLQQSIRFLLVGGLATAVHAAFYAAGVGILSMSPLLANSAAFVIAFLVSFAGHMQWTFPDYSESATGHDRLSALARFLVTAIAGFCMNTAAVLLLVGVMQANPLMAVIPMITITPISTFLLSRYWVFQRVPDGRMRAVSKTSPAIPLQGDLSNKHIFVLCLLWIILVLPGLAFGLPQVLDPDEQIFVYGALEILQHPKFDPGWYGAPGSTLMDALAVVYGSYFLIVQLFGSIDSQAAHFEQNYHVFVLFGRMVTAMAALITSILLYRVLRQSFTELACLIGAASLLLAPEVVSISQVTRMDVFVLLFILAVAFHCNRIIDKPDMKSFVFAGAALGAAVVSKYPGVIAALMIPLAALIAYNRDYIALRTAIKGVVLAAGASILMAAALAPYLFINFDAMLDDVAAEARNVNVGNTGNGFFGNLGFYLAVAIPQTMGPALATFGAIGLIYGMLSENRARICLLVTFGIAFLVFIAVLQLQWVRWALPVAPVLCVGVAALADRLLRSCDVRSYRQALPIAAIFALVLGPSAVTTARSTALKALNHDTRVVTAEWIEKHIPHNSVIALETHTPQLPMDQYRLLIPGLKGLIAADEVWELKKRPLGFYGSFGHMPVSAAEIRNQFVTQAEYVVTSGWEDRYFEDREKYANQYRIYQSIRENFDEMRVFHPVGDMLGGKIAIFKNRREVTD